MEKTLFDSRTNGKDRKQKCKIGGKKEKIFRTQRVKRRKKNVLGLERSGSRGRRKWSGKVKTWFW